MKKPQNPSPTTQTAPSHLDSTLAKKILPPVSDTAEGLRVLDITLPQYAPPSSRGEALVPPAEEFAHLCLDKPFLQTLRAVAIGALHGMPVALEGDTAASKTTAVRFLAHHLNQPILRLNLNGQSDPGEIVGRYVPLEASSLLDSTLLETAPAWLSEKSKCILQTAKAMKRPLSPLEKSVIAAAEGLTSASFRFHEGFLPTAMRNGWWLLLDEVNLAESHVLERLNSALETPPSLALTEGDGTVLGANGTPIQRGFHIFATMNPADYSGRNTLSPAFRDRFGIWHQSALPQEQEIYQMLVAATQGKQPEITIGQVTYQAPTSKPAYPHWQNLNCLNTTLERIATFHAGIAKSSGVDGSTPSLGRHRKERYTFTRRTLLNLLAFVNSSLEGNPESAKDDTLVQQGLRMFYLNKVSDPADRRAIVNILKAATL